jgi:hypothetical protein
VTDTVILGIIVGLPPTIAAITAAWVAVSTKRATTALHESVAKIEVQTNNMNSQMVASAKTEGRQEGKEKAEAAAATTATAVAAGVAALTVTPALPIVIAPASTDPAIMKWIQMGVDIEKARPKDAAGNGPR